MSEGKWRKPFRRFLDFFLPRTLEQSLIEEMSLEKFLQKARRNKEGLRDNITAIFNYKDPLIKSAIWQIKYRNHQRVCRMLAEILYDEILNELVNLHSFANFSDPILIPIPLSAARLAARGYNQTKNLAKEIMRIDNSRSLELLTGELIKIRETEPQSSLPRTLRLQNLRGSFQVKNPGRIRGRNIILIDDVTTTGATFNETSAVLYKVGARKVISFALAH